MSSVRRDACTWNLRLPQIPFFIPREQWFYDKDDKFHVLNNLGHRRSGKTKGESLCINRLVAKYLAEDNIYKVRGDVDSSNPLIAFIAPTKVQARNIIWKYLREDTAEFPGVKLNNTRLTITVPRPRLKDEIEVILLASKNHDRIRGLKIRDAFNDECQDGNEEAIESSIKPALQDTNGFLCTSGTAKGKDFFYKMLCKYIELGAPTFKFPITHSHVYGPEEIAKIKAEMTESAFRREYLLEFLAPDEGAFYADRLNELETEPWFWNADYDPSRTICVGVDIGVGVGFAAWVGQLTPCGKYLNILDYYQGYDALGDLDRDLVEDGYEPDVIFIPFDGMKKQLGRFRSTKVKDIFRDVFPLSMIKDVKKSKNRMIDIDVINRHLHLLRFPEKGSATDAHKGMSMLKEFTRKKDMVTGEYTGTIDKNNKADHAADALKTLMFGLGVEKGRFVRNLTYKKSEPRGIRRRGWDDDADGRFRRQCSIFDLGGNQHYHGLYDR